MRLKAVTGQMSDSFRAAVFIVLSGGFQDPAMVAGAGSMLVLQAYIAVKIVARIRTIRPIHRFLVKNVL